MFGRVRGCEMNIVTLTCPQCGNPHTRDQRLHRKCRNDFCSPECSQAFKVGKPRPGHIVGEADKRTKIAANGLINMRLKRGHITRPDSCIKCGKTGKVDAHHEDYTKPSLVHWLCRSCHVLAHSRAGYLIGIAPTDTDAEMKERMAKARKEAA